MRQKYFDKLSFIVGDMFQHISKEFHWKVAIEAAQTFDRIGHDQKTQEYLK